MHVNKEKSAMLLAAKRAGKILLNYYGKKAVVKQKLNKTLVAAADLEANKIIISTIKKSFPSHSILSEETGFEDNRSDYKWVIDPLDGTHNFLHGIPIFGTSIALEYKNEIILGLLNFPVLRLTAIAEKGKGAFLNGKRIRASNKKEFGYSFILFGFPYSNRKETIDFLDRLIQKTIDVRDFGSAVYHLFLVASGRGDGYIILNTNEWDVSAGILIVEEAGGKITNPKGKKWNFKNRQYVISNGKLHNELLRYLK